MTTKIRIVLDDLEEVADKVQEFLAGLTGVQSASVLKDGEELLDAAQAAATHPATPAEPAPPSEPPAVEAPAEAPTAQEFIDGPEAPAQPAQTPAASSEPVETS
jgi:hypothetical protein